ASPSAPEPPSSFTVRLTRVPNSRLGLRACIAEDNTVMVESIADGGLVHAWNLANADMQVKAGDRIYSVNGIADDPGSIMEELSTSQMLNIQLRHPTAVFASGVAAPAPYTVPSAAAVPPPEAAVVPPAGIMQTPPLAVTASAAVTAPPGATTAPPADSIPAAGGTAPAEETAEPPVVTARPSNAARAGGAALKLLSKVPACYGGCFGLSRSAGGRALQAPALALRGSAAEPKQAAPPAVEISDPRSFWGAPVEVLGFSHTGYSTACDALCKAGFLACSFDLGPGGLQVLAPCEKKQKRGFRNAEAAFQATMFWPLSGMFAEFSAAAALQKAHRM
ncbi:unnamed protein product, partial [Polarella glacialis]